MKICGKYKLIQTLINHIYFILFPGYVESKQLEINSEESTPHPVSTSSVCLVDKTTKYNSEGNYITSYVSNMNNNTNYSYSTTNTNCIVTNTNLASCINASNNHLLANTNLTNSNASYIALNANYTSDIATNSNPNIAANSILTTPVGNFITTNSILTTSNGPFISSNLTNNSMLTIPNSLARTSANFDTDSATYLNQILAAINGDAILINEDNENVILVVQPEEQVNTGKKKKKTGDISHKNFSCSNK